MASKIDQDMNLNRHLNTTQSREQKIFLEDTL